MEYDFSFLYHQSSKDLTTDYPLIDLDVKKWPEAWRTIYYKTYDRFPKIELGYKKVPKDLFDSLSERRSGAGVFAGKNVSQESLGTVLKYSCGISDAKSFFRTYPSSGSRFPLEVYALVLRGDSSLPSGLYHYDVKGHRLNVLWDKKFTNEEVDQLFIYDWVKGASVIFFITAVFERNHMKYKRRGYRYILLEAGHLGQNIYLTSGALGFKCSSLGGTRDKNVEELLDVDGVSESLVYSVAVG